MSASHREPLSLSPSPLQRNRAKRRRLPSLPRRSTSLEVLESRRVFAAFTPGDLVSYVYDDTYDGTGNGPGTPFGIGYYSAPGKVDVQEFSTTGATVQFMNIPTPTTSTSLNGITASVTTQGLISTSTNGEYLWLPGYNSPLNTNPTTGGGSTPGVGTWGLQSALGRTAARLDVAGTLDTSTTNGTTSPMANSSIRGAAAVDGSGVYVSGGTSGTVGINYLAYGATNSVSVTSVPNTVGVGIFNNQLYFTASDGIYLVNGDLPTTSAATATKIVDLTNTNVFPGASLQQFVVSPDGKTIYVADSNNNSTGSPANLGGVMKWTADSPSGPFTYQYTLKVSNLPGHMGARGVAVDWSGANPVVYATTGEVGQNYLVKFVDTGAGAAPTVLATSGAGTELSFRGLAWAPDDGIGAVTGLASANYSTGSAPITFSAASFSDLSNFRGGSVLVQYASGGTVNDALSVKNAGSGAGQIGINGNVVSYEGTQIGTIDATKNGDDGQDLLINFNSLTGGSVTATAVQALLRQIAFSTSSDATSGNRILSFQVTENDGNASAITAASQETIAVAANNGAPQVVNVLVDGTSWSPAFLSSLQTDGLGNGAGYQIPAGSADQYKSVPWSNVNQIEVTFNEPVNVSQGSLSITGVNNATYAISNFTYDTGSNTATWTLSGDLPADKINIDVHASGANAVTSVSGGQALDAQWTDQVSAYPSGNGTAGGDFNFGIHVLPADGNQDGVINGLDIALIASNWLGSSPLADGNADGVVNGLDIALVASNWLASLPAGNPAIGGGGGGGNAVANSQVTSVIAAPLAVTAAASSSTADSYTTNSMSVAASVVSANYPTGGAPAKTSVIDTAHSSMVPNSSSAWSKNLLAKPRYVDDLSSSHIDDELLSILATGPRRT